MASAEWLIEEYFCQAAKLAGFLIPVVHFDDTDQAATGRIVMKATKGPADPPAAKVGDVTMYRFALEAEMRALNIPTQNPSISRRIIDTIFSQLEAALSSPAMLPWGQENLPGGLILDQEESQNEREHGKDTGKRSRTYTVFSATA